MAIDVDIFGIGADYFGQEAVLTSEAGAVSVVGVYELGATEDPQGMTAVTDAAPHFTTSDPRAKTIVEGDSVTIGAVRRSVMDVITDGVVITFLLDKQTR